MNAQSNKRLVAAALLAASALVGQSGASLAASEFLELGELAGGGSDSTAADLSGDGSTIVGVSESTNGEEATLWTAGGTMIGLGDLPGGETYSYAYGVSADGSVVVGRSGSADGAEAFRWTAGGGMVGLGGLTSPYTGSAAYGVNADGSVIVGTSSSDAGYEAFRWTQGGGMVGLGDLAGGTDYSYARGVSADGAVIVGASNSDNGQEAFRWTQGGGMIGLGDLDGSFFDSQATNVSADGQVIVGQGLSTNGYEAFRWTAADGMVGLGDLPGGWFESSARDVNADGSVVVGYSHTHKGYEAFRWKAGTGLGTGTLRVADLLASDNIDLGDWFLIEATGVSDDGQVISGYGINPDGDLEAWRAVVGTGLISVADFEVSLARMGDATGAAHRTAQLNLGMVMNVARHFNQQQDFGQVSGSRAASSMPWSRFRFASSDTNAISLADDEAKRRYSFWAVGTGILDDESEVLSDTSVGAFGISRQGDAGIRVGLGGHFGQDELWQADTNGVGDGTNERETLGLTAYIAYEPTSSPVRLYAVLDKASLEDYLVRAYVNGVEPVVSRGQRDGSSIGMSVSGGWVFPVGEKSTLMPYVEYDLTRIKLDAYTEYGGPFPASFDEVRETTRTTRIGVEGRTPVGEKLALWGTLAWAHRFDDTRSLTSGSIANLATTFSLPGSGFKRDWLEGQVGLSGKLYEKYEVNISLNSSFGADDDRLYGLSIGVGLPL